MKTIIDYLFFRYYMVCIKREEFPRFGATCILAEIVTMAYLFAVLILSFFLTGDFFLPNTSGEERIVIGVIGCFLPWPVIYLYYSKKRIKALLEKYQDNVYNTKYSDKTVLSVRYVVPTIVRDAACKTILAANLIVIVCMKLREIFRLCFSRLSPHLGIRHTLNIIL